MEPVLVAVTIVSLALGAVMSLLAWKLLRHQREQSAARVEALRALSDDPGADVGQEPLRRKNPTFASIDEAPMARTAPAPVPAPAPPPPPEPVAETSMPWDAMRDRPAARPAPRITEIPVHFGTAVEPTAPGRRWAALAAVAAVMTVGFVSVYAFYTQDAAGAIGRLFTASASPSTTEPLQLLSLKHATDDSGTFVLTGLVQNPTSGRPLRGVVAVVYLFDQDGRYFAGGKTPIELTSFHPGEESPFVVKVPDAAGVARYRIGFRMDGGGVVAHVDRRGQLPGGTVEDAAGDGERVLAPQLPGRSEG